MPRPASSETRIRGRRILQQLIELGPHSTEKSFPKKSRPINALVHFLEIFSGISANPQDPLRHPNRVDCIENELPDF